MNARLTCLVIVSLALAAFVSTAATATAADPVIAAAGDIACDPNSPYFNGGLGVVGRCRQKYTSDLLVNAGLTAVLALGDTQYEDGAYWKFLRSYDPSWGRVKGITRPVVGNHEYFRAAIGYGYYFGGRAGPAGKFYYSFDVGTWHLIALNGNCSYVGGCRFGSEQETWLRQDLAAHPAQCILAFWHQPRFSSGLIGNDAHYAPFWTDLYRAGAEVVLNGHDHDYERFARQNPSGAADPLGIREFVAGLGGKSRSGFTSIQPNSERRMYGTFGVLKLTLHPGSYDWQFVPAGSSTFTDTGSEACH
jgi:hypothetical protein